MVWADNMGEWCHHVFDRGTLTGQRRIFNDWSNLQCLLALISSNTYETSLEAHLQLEDQLQFAIQLFGDIRYVYNTNNSKQLNIRNATTSDSHRNCSKLRPPTYVTAQSTPTDKELSDDALVLSVEAATIGGWRKMIHCSHRRLMHKRFQVALEEEIQRIESWGAWIPINKSVTSNPPSKICSMEVGIHRNGKMCWDTIIHEPHALVCSGCYSLHSWESAYVQVFSTLPRYFKSPHTFGYSPRLVHCPPDSNYYSIFHVL
ncbi:hypothetical protein TNCV_603761 [Trichonephila clavipes]|nr:hypothetical protein TNCV_603761 [Trichonephila clavipes]